MIIRSLLFFYKHAKYSIIKRLNDGKKGGLYFKIKEIVQFTDSPISLPDFINNLVKYHLETYKEEIYEIRSESVEYIRVVFPAKKE